jgi:hypothetical protein
MGPLWYMRYVVDRNVVMQRMTVYVMLRYSTHGAAPSDTSVLAVRNEFNRDNYTETSLIYFH